MYRRFFKRFIDVIMSFIGIIITSPIMLVVAVLIKCTSCGPILFRQKRIGKDSKVFIIYKFRTMKNNSEHTGSGVYSGKNDPRVTRIGKILRATSMDELPQFFNILKGDMSLIGPRPVLTYHPWTIDKYSKRQLRRFSVRPGITGWAQIHGRKQVLWKRRMEYDCYYVENLSFFLDVEIFLKTIYQVIKNENNINTISTVEGEK